MLSAVSNTLGSKQQLNNQSERPRPPALNSGDPDLALMASKFTNGSENKANEGSPGAKSPIEKNEDASPNLKGRESPAMESELTLRYIPNNGSS